MASCCVFFSGFNDLFHHVLVAFPAPIREQHCQVGGSAVIKELTFVFDAGQCHGVGNRRGGWGRWKVAVGVKVAFRVGSALASCCRKRWRGVAPSRSGWSTSGQAACPPGKTFCRQKWDFGVRLRDVVVSVVLNGRNLVQSINTSIRVSRGNVIPNQRARLP